MARVTVEDSLKTIPSRFALVVIASQRMRDLVLKKDTPKIECKNKEAVTALREVAAKKVYAEEDIEQIALSYNASTNFSDTGYY